MPRHTGTLVRMHACRQAGVREGRKSIGQREREVAGPHLLR